MFLILVLIMLFASTFTIGKAALMYTSPIFFIGTRMVIGGGLLLLYQYIRHREARIALKDLGLIAQLSFFQFYMSFILEFWGLQYVSSSKACLIFNLSPFFTAVVSFFLLRERLSVKKLLSLVIGFLGLLPVLQESAPSEEVVPSVAWFSSAELSLLASVFFACYGWILCKKIKKRGYNVILINSYTMTSSGVASLITSFLAEGAPRIMPPAECYSQKLPWLCSMFGDYGAGVAMFVFYLLALVLIANIIAFNLYGYLLSFYSATFVSFACILTPLFTAFFSWWYLGETVGWGFWLSMFLVSIGLTIFYSEELRASS